MFRVTFMVEDKRLAPALNALGGLVLDLQVVPVVNVAVAENGAVKAKSRGTFSDMFLNHLKENKITSFKAKEAKDFMRSVGARSYSASLLSLKKQKIIKKTGTGMGTVWTVML